MEIHEGDIVKHFKGKDLIEKNIYEIIAVGPKYTGTNDFTEEPMVIYRPIFQVGKTFIREYDSLIEELSPTEKEEYGQINRVNILTEDELSTVKSPEFISKKIEFLVQKYGNESVADEDTIVRKLK